MKRRSFRTIATAATLAAAAGTVFAGAAFAQTSVQPRRVLPGAVETLVGVDSGWVRQSPAVRGPATVYATVVGAPGAVWTRLKFGDMRLGEGASPATRARLRMTSLADGDSCEFTSEHLFQWANHSPYFKGGQVMIEVVAWPDSADSRLVIDSVVHNPPAMGPDTICGPTDDRARSNHARVGRYRDNLQDPCTVFLINDAHGCLLTANHCDIAPGHVVEFNCPDSTATGVMVPAALADQYAPDGASIQRSNANVIGNDWAYFGCFPNPVTGQTPRAVQGVSFALAAAIPAPANQNLRVTGNGDGTGTAGTLAHARTQKTATGPFTAQVGGVINHQVDTTSGNSGSPVFLEPNPPPAGQEPNGDVIAIHTNGGCANPAGATANRGTAVLNAGLQAALGAPTGVCADPPIRVEMWAPMMLISANGASLRLGCDNTVQVTSLQPGGSAAAGAVPGYHAGRRVQRQCAGAVPSFMQGTGLAQLALRYDAAGAATIRWDSQGNATYRSAVGYPEVFDATGQAGFGLTWIVVRVSGPPVGTPVTVNYAFWQFTSNDYAPELPYGILDDAASAGGGLSVYGIPLIISGNPPAGHGLYNKQGNVYHFGQGSFLIESGYEFVVALEGGAMATIMQPAFGLKADSSSTGWRGTLHLATSLDSIDSLCTADPVVEFSLDIGSDAELSDPAPTGNERFDPGDLYAWRGASLVGPANGLLDDAAIFGTDPAPTPGGTTAPACSGGNVGAVSAQVFDLDAADSTDFSLLLMPGYSASAPLGAPLPKFGSVCLHSAEFLLISYDDDDASHFVAGPPCTTPAASLSPAQDRYGRDATKNEVLGVLLVPGAPPFPAATHIVASESEVHTSLGPDPDAAEAHDDDVDALDAVPESGGCPFRYISADHEGHAGLDPGDVYLLTPGGPVVAVDEVIHLGLPDSADVDAFEFAWVFHEESAGEVLTAVFSVADDDPLTPGDESGGLDAAMVYASRLTGSNFPLLDQPLADDVDAIAAWCRPVILPEPCYPDCNADGLLTVADFGCFQTRFVAGDPYADCNQDTVLTVADFGCFQTKFVAGCP